MQRPSLPLRALAGHWIRRLRRRFRKAELNAPWQGIPRQAVYTPGRQSGAPTTTHPTDEDMGMLCLTERRQATRMRINMWDEIIGSDLRTWFANA